MLAVGSKHRAKQGVLLGRDLYNNDNITCVDDEELPCQGFSGASAIEIVDEEDLLQIFKRFSLSKKDINQILEFYRDPESETLESDDWKLSQAFRCVEQLILSKLKRFYHNPTSRIVPAYDPSNMRGHVFCGCTRSGKTWRACEILCMFPKIKVYVFTLNQDDETLQMLRQKRPKKNTVFVDLNKLEGQPLRLRT